MTARLSILVACAAALSLAACSKKGGAPAGGAPTAQERQDRALKDPFGYKPDWRDTDISGGDASKLDKDGFQRDLGHVIMP